jgi:hypothetical protein
VLISSADNTGPIQTLNNYSLKLALQISSTDGSGNDASQCCHMLHLGQGLNPFTGSLGKIWHMVALASIIGSNGFVNNTNNKTSCSLELVDTTAMCVMTSLVLTVMYNVLKNSV